MFTAFINLPHHSASAEFETETEARLWIQESVAVMENTDWQYSWSLEDDDDVIEEFYA